MKTLLCPIILLFTLASCKSDYFTTVNRKLDPNLTKRDKVIVSSYHVRKKIYEQGYLSFITEKDTIFLLSDYDLPSAIHYGTIWTKNKRFHYSYSNGIVSERDEDPIEKSNSILTLISKWDTITIKKESSLNYNQLFPSHMVLAYRVYKPDKKIIIDRIKFRPFY